MSPQLVIQYQLVNPKNIYNISNTKRLGKLCLCIYSYMRICMNIYEENEAMNLRGRRDNRGGAGRRTRGK